jgi:Do/DeqQ family serine protease
MNQRKRIITAVAVIALVLAPMVLFAKGRSEQVSGDSAPTATAQSAAQLSDASKNLATIQYSFQEVAKAVLPVVVELDVTETVSQTVPQGFEWFFQAPQQGGKGTTPQRQAPTQRGLGSGIIVRHTANHYYVLTNNHVVGSATQITAKTNDGRTFKAKLVATDERRDLAMVSFDTSDSLPVAELGDSSELQVGDIVLAVGNPWGFQSTITMGIVSALGRTPPDGADVATYNEYIQTDAAINEGNSGGALVNIYGQVIGINTWIASSTQGSIGLGFAIPINAAKSDIEAFLTSGKVQYGWLGVSIGTITNNLLYDGYAKDLKLPNTNGALVLSVYKGSPADKAGILPGDFITKAAGSSVADNDQLTQIVGGLPAGKGYDFELIRLGAKLKVTVTIAVRDEAAVTAQYKNLWPGMTVINITDEIRQEAAANDTPIPDGVAGLVVGQVQSSSPAAIGGFKVGDVITQLNGVQIRTTYDFFQALNDKSKSNLSFRVNRQGTELTIGLTR